MMRDYIGTGYKEPGSYGVDVEQDGKRDTFTRSVRGVRVAYQWDGDGPLSSDLARALLCDVTGAEPEWKLYRLFKNEVVAAWPRHLGECWRISEDQIKQWLDRVQPDKASNASNEDTYRMESLQRQMQDREQRLRRFR